MKICKDAKGLYITGRGLGLERPYRPGNVSGYEVAYDMSDGGLKEGDNPKTRHIPYAPLIKIQLEDGRVLHWATETELDKYEQMKENCRRFYKTDVAW